MSTKKNTANKTRIAFIGKFKRLHDEEYIARSFEMLGCEVLRIEETSMTGDILEMIEEFKPDIVLWIKFTVNEPAKLREALRKYTTVCWVFDLYFGYQREYRLRSHPAFTANYIFTTDGGHEEEWKEFNHKCIRQGIYKDECFMLEDEPLYDVVFVGSDNPLNEDRVEIVKKVRDDYDFHWFGRFNTNQVRGVELNKLYAKTKVVIGDSVFSPGYWSNRVVETLGRGGFLIHRDVPGLKTEYPHLITYDGSYRDLKSKIDYYLKNDEERKKIIKRNFEWVKENYTMDKQCQKLLNYISLKTSPKETQTDN